MTRFRQAVAVFLLTACVVGTAHGAFFTNPVPPRVINEFGGDNWEYVMDYWWIDSRSFALQGFDANECKNQWGGALWQRWDVFAAGHAWWNPGGMNYPSTSSADGPWQLTGYAWEMTNIWHGAAEYGTGAEINWWPDGHDCLEARWHGGWGAWSGEGGLHCTIRIVHPSPPTNITWRTEATSGFVIGPTPPPPPGIESHAASDVTVAAATANGQLLSNGLSYAYVFWGTVDQGTNASAWTFSNNLGQVAVGPCSGPLTGLSPDMEYFYRLAARNAGGFVWSTSTVSFTTGMPFDDWIYRMKITFSGYTKDEMLSGFPALAVLSTNLPAFLYSQFADPAGGDIRFVAPNEIDPLNFEIEEWNTNGDSFVWVQVPSLTNDSWVWMYWGNTNSTTLPASSTNGATWSEGNYLGVWHLHDTNDAGSLPESSFNGVNGVNVGSVSAGGVIASGQDMAGTGRVDVTSISSTAGSYTFHYWLNSTQLSNSVPLTDIETGPIDTLWNNTGAGQVGYFDGVTNGGLGSGLNDGTWHHVVFALDASAPTGTVYVDGQDVGSRPYTSRNIGGPAWLAGDASGSNGYSGLTDEIRISTTARSSNWIWACWFNQASNDTFCTYGSVTEALEVAALPPTDVTDADATLNGEVVSCGPALPDAWICWGTSDGGTSDTGSWQNVTYAGNAASPGDAFSAVASPLSPGVVYHYRCYLAGAAGEAWSQEEVFESDSAPTVNNGAATDITMTSATLAGDLVDGGNAEAFIYWGLTDGDTTPALWANTSVVGTVGEETFSVDVSVAAGGRYFYRCAATNGAGTDWAATTDSFTTPLASISIADVELVETDTGATSVVFSVTLSAACASNVMVNFDTSPGTAAEGPDYVGTNGTLVIPQGMTTGQIVVEVVGDTNDDGRAEVFYVDLDTPVNALLPDTQAECTILDEDWGDWLYSMHMDFAGYDGSGVLTNFPALIILSEDILGFSYSQFQAGGTDLRFADGADGTEFCFEIEKWNPSGQSFVWVQLPRLTAAAAIDVYWGNSGAAALPAYATNGSTWSEGYVAVWHLDESSGTHHDSSGNDNDGFASNNVDQAGMGIVAGCDVFDGSNDWVHVLDSDEMDGSEELTVEAWVFDAAAGGIARGMVSKRTSAGVDQSYGVYLGDDGKVHNMIGTSDYSGNSALPGETWQYVTAAFERWPESAAGVNELYLNGDLDSNREYVPLPSVPATPSDLHIGILNADYGDGWMGSLDEIRVSSVRRTPDWIRACYLTVASNDSFATYADVDVGDAPVINGMSVTGVTTTSAFLNGRLAASGAPPTAVWVFWGQSDAGMTPQDWDHTNSFGPHSGPVPAAYSFEATGLTPDETYYYRYRASNTIAESWSSVPEHFITGPMRMTPTDSAAAEEGQDPGEVLIWRPATCTDEAITVRYTIGGTASNGHDYVLLSDTAFIPQGETSAVITVTPYDDGYWDEYTEDAVFSVVPGNYPLAPDVRYRGAVVRIRNNEDIRHNWNAVTKITFSGYTKPTPLVNFPALVVFSTNIPGFSYSQFFSDKGYDLMFLRGIDPIVLDYEIEEWDTNGESFVWVRIPELTQDSYIWAYWSSQSETNPLPCLTNGSVWIEDFDAVLHLNQTNGVGDLRDSTVNDRDGWEPDTMFTFNVAMSETTVSNVTVNFVASNGTALAGSDYVLTNSIVTIPSGQQDHTISVLVPAERARVDQDPDEYFSMHFSSPTGAVLFNDTAFGTILIPENAPAPLMWINDVAVNEETNGTSIVDVAITLSRVASNNVTVDFFTSNGTAEAGLDYAETNGTATILSGASSTFITLEVYGDTENEGSYESFSVHLANPSNATVIDSDGWCAIMETNGPVVWIGDAFQEWLGTDNERGLIAWAQDYNNGRIFLPNYADQKKMTFMCWVNLPPGGGGYFFHLDWGGGLAMEYDVHESGIHGYQGWYEHLNDNRPISANNYHHIAIVRSNYTDWSVASSFIDGTRGPTKTLEHGYITTPLSAGRDYTGIIDEWRLSPVLRSDDWIWACWMNQGFHDSFITYSPVIYDIWGGSVIQLH